MSIVLNATLTVKSPVFADSGPIPAKYTCDGSNVSPELHIINTPPETKSLALIVDDPDAPGGTFVHWVMWNIPPAEIIKENTAPGIQGRNGKNENKYYGPCPPKGTHHYHFHIYALDTKLDIPTKTDKQALLLAMEGHIIASGELMGTYKKAK
ncbi:MAG TPA: YbhB/YbcL family Raf kinase inhibitor-like protein [Bacteroidia bacterium]|jgi:Raf kinase inhibitor-like YbhB/YbcL family protein|nr:YbhB/YbcL family Raf kinase inhibitor-like protein [Bacteroidia bacterium]